MSPETPPDRSRRARRLMIVAMSLVAVSLLTLIVCVRFFDEYEWAVAIACAVVALIAGALFGKSRSVRQEHLRPLERQGVSPRGSGAALAGAVLLAIYLIDILVPPARWPATVDTAVDWVHARLDDRSRRDLAYLPEDSGMLHMSLGLDMRNTFGMWAGNHWLLGDCGSGDPDGCSATIIERLRQRVRDELPAGEREALETLETRMARVEVPAHEFKDVRLAEYADFLRAAVARLPAEQRFEIVVDERDANELVTVEESRVVSMTDIQWVLLRSGMDGRMTPPTYTLEPYFRPLAPDFPVGKKLVPLFETTRGQTEPVREFVLDAASWEKLRGRLPGHASALDIDFARHRVLLVSLGRREGRGNGIDVQVDGIHGDRTKIWVVEVRPGDRCGPGLEYPTGIYLLPAEMPEPYFPDGEVITHRDCGNQ